MLSNRKFHVSHLLALNYALALVASSLSASLAENAGNFATASDVGMPAMAQKAGGGGSGRGHLPREYQNPGALGDNRVPAMARKAGGSWRQELSPTPVTPDDTEHSEHKEHNIIDTSVDDEESYEYDYDDEEIECPRDKFFHIRGKTCVPFHCPGGPTARNPETGECNRSNDYNYGRRYYGGTYRGGGGRVAISSKTVFAPRSFGRMGKKG